MLVPSSQWGPMIQRMELNDLCSLILEGTINDPDKYQNGKTKIFFRAGMLAALETLRADRLSAMVTVVQKNMRRHMCMKRYRMMRTAAIRIQTWWRGILARRFVAKVRRETAAVRFQKAARRYIQRKRFTELRTTVVRFQSRTYIVFTLIPALIVEILLRTPGLTGSSRIQGTATGARNYPFAKPVPRDVRRCAHPNLFYSWHVCSLVRRVFRSDVRHVIYMQSCIRRRLARRQLKALKAEARSVSKFKEISYRLENKVVELTQTLQKRTEEKNEVTTKLAAVELQLKSWMSRHEEVDARAKQLTSDLTASQAHLTRHDELLRQKENIEKRLEEAVATAQEREQTIRRLEDDIMRQASELEHRAKQVDSLPIRTAEDSSVILTLKNEVSSLREQLNRAHALQSLTRGPRDPPVSPTFAPTLRHLENGATAPEEAQGVNGGHSATARHQRRHSSAGVYALSGNDNRTSVDELMSYVKRTQTANPRAVSVAYNGEEGIPRLRGTNGLSDIYDDPAEEKIRLLQDIRNLDEDVLEGLIKGLKIPLPSLTNPSAVKEILFPANLISLVTNEMWKYGLIPESERFLANVMQTIQAHVMASIPTLSNYALLSDALADLQW
jgi:myosin-5